MKATIKPSGPARIAAARVEAQRGDAISKGKRAGGAVPTQSGKAIAPARAGRSVAPAGAGARPAAQGSDAMQPNPAAAIVAASQGAPALTKIGGFHKGQSIGLRVKARRMGGGA